MTTTLTPNCLLQFTGDDIRYRHSLSRNVIYTPGLRHVADAGGAYWMLDEIALALGSRSMQRWLAADPRVGEMQFWTLAVNADSSATLSGVADAGVTPFFQKRIAWTDFPLERVDIWCGYDRQRWTLYLPSEH